MPRTELTGAQRKRLRGLAHDLDALIQIGSGGLSENVLSNIDKALEHHELIKVRFMALRQHKKTLCSQIENRLDCHLAGLVGHVAILYRSAAREDDRRVQP
jgi:RNA-binding protein